MSDYHVIVEAKDSADDGKAREIAEILCEAYPGHPWHINITGGVIVIKHMRLTDSWGMVRKYSRVTFDAGVLKHEMIMAAGEFLERAGLTRGKFDEAQLTRHIDGVPDRHIFVQ